MANRPAPTLDISATSDRPDESTRSEVDDQPLSPVDEAKGKLEKLISGRPGERELVEKNIMKDTKVAPALQAQQAELQRAQLEDGILSPEEAPDATLPAEKVEPPSIA